VADLWFEFSDETGETRTKAEFEELLEDIREVVNKHGYDISGYAQANYGPVAIWYGTGKTDEFPGLDELIASGFIDVDISKPIHDYGDRDD